jgi:hypothetical protein
VVSRVLRFCVGVKEVLDDARVRSSDRRNVYSS